MRDETGYRQDKFDHRDQYYRPPHGTQPEKSVNLRERYKDDFSKVYDQGSTNSCTANAATACFWYEEKSGRRKEVWGEAGPSRWFVYWLARGGYKTANHEIEGGAKNVGSDSRDAMKGIAKCGVCVEDKCPFPNEEQMKKQILASKPRLTDDQMDNEIEKIIDSIATQKPSDDAFKDAAPHNGAFYYRLDPDRPDVEDKNLSPVQMDAIGIRLLTDLKACLTEGYPVAFGYWNYLPQPSRWKQNKGDLTVMVDPWDPKGDNYPRHKFPWNLPSPLKEKVKGAGGHSVLAVGYNDDALGQGKGAVLVQNSWGPSWSKDGVFWIPYNWITDFAASNDFWTIRSQPLPGKPALWEQVNAEIKAAA